MTTAASDPFEIVCSDPAAYFDTPQAIVDDPTLTRTEKLQLLDEWAHDLDDRSRSAAEGMIPDATGLLDRDVKLGAAIVAARLLVETGADTPGASLPVRLWRRLIGATG